MRVMLALYTDSRSATYGKWGPSGLQAAVSLARGRYCARQLAKLCRAFIENRKVLLVNPYGDWNETLLVDEDLLLDVNLYLQQLGKDITGAHLMQFLRSAEGQFIDGHERVDVVIHRNHNYLPRLKEYQARAWKWTKDNELEFGPHPQGKCVIIWFHDETIFYAHDRRRIYWVHKDSSAKPQPKGEGASLMIADFVSADFGFLTSLNGHKTARQLIKPGKNRDGYFTNDNIIAQANCAIDILNESYPDFEHVLVYDNATTHQKRPDNAISARKMPKNRNAKWGVVVTDTDENGNPKLKATKKITMANRTFSNGEPQEFYHENGDFKGMAKILEERGFADACKLRVECPGFNCVDISIGAQCCCRRILFNQPDFTNVKSKLETACDSRGVPVLFLPKFHCELNPIEQVWGYAKRLYRLCPESSREDTLEKNSLESLNSLDGPTAAWATKQFHGHRVLPDSIMDLIEQKYEATRHSVIL
ncbi:hypothetical protein FA15DRAFT_682357 [Coprinopsis marcescibilis]|uniref:Tc1-like transposase DDE domain-containing protein n=1 Tax=Coprinopsis marcescibilis TaxID=230819 RepID=A0A5C3KKI9_COPMA|nr:hypothetical protein FA15DRAFT_682357 [Coprinopsis marcescibilis]